jgi:hypothetical protein
MKIKNPTKSLDPKLKLGQKPVEKTEPSAPEPKSLISIIGQCLPFAPLVFEQFTGQKVPQLTGTVSEIQSTLQQLTTSLQQALTNQQEIFARIVNLEASASQQLTSLDKRIEGLQSLRLTHEKKQIEYQQPKLETYE